MARSRAILDAAARLFYERGFDGVGVDEIGVAAGVTGPAIYRHFDNKDEILATLFDEAMDRLLALAGPPREDPGEELRALILAQADFALRDRELVSVYSREERSLAQRSRRRLHRRQRQHVERWVDVLGRCYPECGKDELTSAAYAAIGMLLSVAHWPREARATPNLEDLLERLVVDGLSALARRRDRRTAASAPGTSPREGKRSAR